MWSCPCYRERESFCLLHTTPHCVGVFLAGKAKDKKGKCSPRGAYPVGRSGDHTAPLPPPPPVLPVLPELLVLKDSRDGPGTQILCAVTGSHCCHWRSTGPWMFLLKNQAGVFSP